MKIKDLVFSVSLLTKTIYLGITNKSGEEYLQKEDVTAKILASVIEFVGENKSKTITFGSGAKYKITIENLNNKKLENELM